MYRAESIAESSVRLQNARAAIKPIALPAPAAPPDVFAYIPQLGLNVLISDPVATGTCVQEVRVEFLSERRSGHV